MAAGKGNAPVIIKRITVSGGGGHHGGAWKVAYADFVTAMMAFFLLMWLLNATTEKQRQGLADYFDPTIVNASGGGSGIEGGQAPQTPADAAEASADAAQRQDFEQAARAIQDRLTGSGAESMQRVNLLRHVVTRMTDEGLVIELGDIVDEPLFAGETADPTPVLRELTGILASVLGQVRNPVAVSGHVRGYPEMMVEDPAWPLSDDRAHGVRKLLAQGGMDPDRVRRVTAHGDRRPRNANPMDPANNRVEVILLR
ncbi:OmpA/MotB family protein [Paracoccus luteus]|uniref:OmpA/MotB family protein n=1 Tax=Paracoccus luteus TaxID=2508543 RepID=UPI00106F6F9E|nr:flagellar motor protein MotB [Paracoccus luteus]